MPERCRWLAKGDNKAAYRNKVTNAGIRAACRNEHITNNIKEGMFNTCDAFVLKSALSSIYNLIHISIVDVMKMSL